jgi:TM2 domain-containing membrane protein YozV
MDCVNHSGVTATAYCQSCGKALCAGCVRNAAAGQILCDPCASAWQAYQQPFAVAPPHPCGPKPAAAAVLGLFPGVGAMYNGQFIKGFIHVVIFAVLVSISNHFGVTGILVAAWIIYQSFEAYHTAKAIRDGQPLPDPLGLNEVGAWFNPGVRQRYPGQPGVPAAAANPGPPAQDAAGQATAGYQPPFAAQYQAPYPQAP